MSAEHHRRTAELFLKAAQLDGAQREAFLDEACGEDAALRREVEEMLELDRGATTFLERPALGDAFRVRTDGGAYENAEWPAPAGAAPESIGPYRILGVLGDGGMGVVYRAEQINPRRTVALKVLHRRSYDPNAVRRFELEAQVLARLQHPNIAQVYEAGSYHDPALGADLPFLAMELVEGAPLLRHAAEHTLDVPRKLELMLQLCDAVEHAHQRGVIHRDLKPANILVQPSGRAKVLDFGIARVVADDWQATLVTRDGQLVGTLAYMSPEQLELDAAAIDTRADVYALGVMLYELLTGSLPHDVRGKTLPQIVQTLRDEEPRPLGRTARALRGDLSDIAAKALERDRERRYASVADFAADLRRYLNSEPISARPQTTIYQLRKLARRHKELVAGLAAVFLALVLGVIGLSKYAVDLSRARAEERIRSDELRQVSDFQAAMLSGIDAQLMGLRLREVLLVEHPHLEADLAGINFTDIALKSLHRNVIQRALDTIDRDFAEQPLVRARLLQSVADTLAAIGLVVQAIVPQERALALRRELLGNDHPETLASVHSTGYLLVGLGRLDEAEASYLESLEGRRRVLGDEHPDTLRSIARMANLRALQGRPAEAIEYGREAHDGYRRVLGDEHEDTLHALHVQIPPAHAIGDLDLAESNNRQVLEGRRRVLGEDHPDTLTSLNNMGVILASQGRLEEALDYASRAMEGRLRVLGREHSQTLQSLNNVAKALEGLNRHADAEPILRAALEATIRLRGEEHPAVCLYLCNLGRLLLELGHLDEAEELLMRGVDGYRRAVGEDHVEAMGATASLVTLLRRTARLDEAEALGERLLGAMERTLDPDNWMRSRFLQEHALTLAAMNRFDEAEELMLDAHRIVAAALGKTHAQTARAIERIILLYRQWSDADPLAGAESRLVAWQAASHDLDRTDAEEETADAR